MHHVHLSVDVVHGCHDLHSQSEEVGLSDSVAQFEVGGHGIKRGPSQSAGRGGVRLAI